MSGLPGQDLLAQIENENPKLGQYLRQYLGPAITRTAQNAAVSPTASVAPPQPPQSVRVQAGPGMMQVVVDHDVPLQRGAHYIYSVGTNRSLIGAQIEAKPATRSPVHFALPDKDSGGNAHNYYVGVQVQYPGGPPSTPVYYGGAEPKAVNLTGSTQMDILPGTGSGTAVNGADTLVGLGKSPVRL